MEEQRVSCFQSCCRLCLCESADSLRSIFDESLEDRDLPQKISECLAVEICVNDKLSKMVCEQCLSMVKNWHLFKDQCELNQSKLQEWLANNYQNEHQNGLDNATLQIKEEPIDEATDESIEENEEPDSRNDDIVTVKRELVESNDVSMEEDYNELPPSLSPQEAKAEVFPDNDYRCSLCSKLFVNKGNKKRHERRVHGLHTNKEPTLPVINGVASGSTDDSPSTSSPYTAEKIQFAAGLKLLKKNSTPISCEALSKIELSYVEKCKAMVNMHQTLTCACHNVSHQNLKGLLSHLRALRIWFPVFTCYNCMITFTDGSTFTRHIVRCPSQSLDTITKLSNLRKRSEVKTRLYQNFKCTSCKFMYSFHDTFCKHVDEEHGSPELPAECRCGRSFDNIDDYRDHVYVSCMVEYYCDICFITTNTLEEFQKHAAEVHDNSEGFILLQDDNYKIRKPSMPGGVKEDLDASETQSPKVEGVKTPRLVPNLALVHPSTDQRKCPICGKEYSSYKNMMRHYKIHTTELQLKTPNNEEPEAEESFYACPDCGGMYDSSEWQQHLEEKHEIKTCLECGKCFQFMTEFEQHRSAHLNIKVFRDSKTQAYRSTMLSPSCEEEPSLRCKICDLTFATNDEFQVHLSEHAEENMELEAAETHKMTPSSSNYPKQCPECDKVLTTGAAFYRHKLIHEKDIPSDASLNKGPARARKSEDVEEESYHTCKKCFKVFSSKYNLKCHMKCHGIHLSPSTRNKSPRKPYCNICQRVFNSALEVLEHKEAEHSSEEMPMLGAGADGPVVFTCDVCVMTFATKMALKKHKETHVQEGRRASRISCKYCKVSFDSIVGLTKHMHVEHNENGKPKLLRAVNFTCDICKKSFATSSALSTHIGWHKRDPTTGSGKIMRNQKIMAKLANSTMVKQEAVELPNFQCTTCLAELPNDTALQVHILEKHRSVSAIMLIPRCHICNKDFPTQDEYETHKRLHDFLERQKQHEQNLLLQQSPKELITSPQQNAVSPTSKKNYPCKYCSAGFSRSDTLGAHVRQHHKEYVTTEFKCHHCDRVFDKQNSLSIHLKVHEKQKTVPMQISHSKPLFSCSICNMGFNLPKDLRAHTISAHPF